jgi:transcriptional regulator with XRE-family HTH domain
MTKDTHPLRLRPRLRRDFGRTKSAILRQARLEAGFTQVAAGKKLNKQAYISKIERGERRIDAVELDELAKIYSKSLDYFTKGNSN